MVSNYRNNIFASEPKKVRRYLKPTNDSWRIDETYIKIKGG